VSLGIPLQHNRFRRSVMVNIQQKW